MLCDRRTRFENRPRIWGERKKDANCQSRDSFREVIRSVMRDATSARTLLVWPADRCPISTAKFPATRAISQVAFARNAVAVHAEAERD